MTMKLLHEDSWFSPLLEGYFHSSVTKILTGHLLSVHPETVYYSLSLHLVNMDKNFFIIII